MDFLTIVGQLALSTTIGAIIGWERENQHKAAGYRTLGLVSLGVTLFTQISQYGFNGVEDPSRVAAQIVTGIGFLGAGLIIFQGDKIHNLTTAATVWVVAALGMAVGVGWYMEALVATAFSLLLLSVFRKLTPNKGKQ